VAEKSQVTIRGMTVVAPSPARTDPRRRPLDVEIVVPVYNEAHQLADRITVLRRFLDEEFPFRTVVTIVDNASTDGTDVVAQRLAATIPGVAALNVPRKGRGRALRAAWTTSAAPVVAYMDVDLSTSLSALLPLVAPLLSGHRDVAIGSRLARGAHVVRGPKRELISRAYNLLLRVALRGRFSDAQCGFKALRRESAQQILPLVEDDEWFFDTELLIVAERLGLRITEVPVDWVDDPDSRVKIARTAWQDLRGVWRMAHGWRQRRSGGPEPRPVEGSASRPGQLAADQLMRFAGVGAISTLGYLFFFIAWRPLAGIYGANALALAICTFFNTAVHRELAGRSTARGARLVLVAVGLFAVSLTLTTLALMVSQLIDPASLILELLAVTAANAAAAVLRFTVLRGWVFRPSVARTTTLPEVSE
jgi:putative flippase GtrA